MRITYLHQYFNTPEMSGGTRSFEMARRLVSQGHQVSMITSWRGDGRGNDWFQTIEEGICVHWLPLPYSNYMSYGQRIRAFLQFAIRSALKAATLEADIVFATSTPLTIAIPAVFASRRQKVPFVFEVRDLWPETPIAIGAIKNKFLQFLARRFEYWAYQSSASIIALSPGMKAGVVASGYPTEKIAVIPNSSDNQFFALDSVAAFKFQRYWLAGHPLLVYAGTFGRVNGVGYAVDLAKALIDIGSNVQILLVGDGAERPFVMRKAREMGVLQRNIFFEPQLPKKDMPALFLAATVCSSFVIDLPEMRANSANKFFDAMAAGKPILLNHGGWMHDLVQKHDCGLAMWQKPIEQVAQEVHQKMNDNDWVLRAGASARRLAEECFDRDKLAYQLERLLLSVHEGKPDFAERIAPGIYN